MLIRGLFVGQFLDILDMTLSAFFGIFEAPFFACRIYGRPFLGR
jgi:hypothetical protein